MTQTLSERLWVENRDLARASLESRFVRHLSDGSLPRKVFQDYIAQDAFFLEAFARAYAFALSYSKARQWIFEFAELLNGVLNELDLHDGYAAEWDVDLSATRPNPATLKYTGFLLETAQSGDVGETCAAMTPCMRLYAFIGQELMTLNEGKTHSYSEWIRTYGSPDFHGLAAKLESLLDSHASDHSAVHSHYRRAMELELEFFRAHEEF